MKRAAILGMLLLPGCSTAPIADLLDFFRPAKLGAERVAPYGGVCNPRAMTPPVVPAVAPPGFVPAPPPAMPGLGPPGPVAPPPDPVPAMPTSIPPPLPPNESGPPLDLGR